MNGKIIPWINENFHQSYKVFVYRITPEQVKKLLLLQGFRGDAVNTQVLTKDADGLCQLSQAALVVFEEVKTETHCTAYRCQHNKGLLTLDLL